MTTPADSRARRRRVLAGVALLCLLIAVAGAWRRYADHERPASAIRGSGITTSA